MTQLNFFFLSVNIAIFVYLLFLLRRQKQTRDDDSVPRDEIKQLRAKLEQVEHANRQVTSSNDAKDREIVLWHERFKRSEDHNEDIQFQLDESNAALLQESKERDRIEDGAKLDTLIHELYLLNSTPRDLRSGVYFFDEDGREMAETIEDFFARAGWDTEVGPYRGDITPLKGVAVWVQASQRSPAKAEAVAEMFAEVLGCRCSGRSFGDLDRDVKILINAEPLKRTEQAES